MSTKYFDKKGAVVSFGKKIGEGGEGAVFEIPGRAGYVAKVYKNAPDREKSQKLQLMSSLKVDALTPFAAWPVTPLYAGLNGPIEGIVMPRIVDACEIHQLYNPSHRKQSFPNFDFRHLLRSARNCAIAFAKLHESSVVIGDVNQGNFFVDKQARVKLIDCDSFQLTSGTVVYKCHVGVPHFTPPELHSRKLSECVRTQNHDNFGLAIMIFHLLFMGRHPFVGYTGKGDMPIERAIQEFRFAYGSSAARYEMKPPPNSITSRHIPGFVFNLFEKAFSPTSCKDGDRPTASEWEIALAKLEGALHQCKDDDAHYYWNLNQSCPWCEIANNGGPNFFLSLSSGQSIGPDLSFSLDEINRQISVIPNPLLTFRPPQQLPPLPVTSPRLPIAAADETRIILGILAIVFVLLGLIGLVFTQHAILVIGSGVLFGAFWYKKREQSTWGKERRRRKQKLESAERELERVENEVKKIARLHVRSFKDVMVRFDSMKTEWQRLSTQRTQELSGLQKNAKDRQMEVYLKSHFIATAKIYGIGDGRIAALESYGIDSAWQVTQRNVLSVPGFGPELASRLIAWRHELESRFRFNSSQAVPSSVIQAVEAKYNNRRKYLENCMRGTPGELRKTNDVYAPQVQAMSNLQARAEQALTHAMAEFEQLPRLTF
jgi:DNA-binding helix-hairpin-helix protein with protein kinase domain